MKPRVELIYDTDCPNVLQARQLLLHAFAEAHLQPSWKEFDRKAADSPPYAKLYGSPTVLVNGEDVAGANSGNDAACCRLYAHERGIQGVPQLSQIVRALNLSTPIPMASRFHWRQFLTTLPSLAALLPVLHCPACWPAYAGILTALGLGFLFQATYLFPITGALLLLALFTLGYRARARHGYLPLGCGLMAVSTILIGKFLLMSGPAVYAGLTILFVISVWNAWPRKEAYYAQDRNI